MRLERYVIPADATSGAKLVPMRAGAMPVEVMIESGVVALYCYNNSLVTQMQDRFFHISNVNAEVMCSPEEDPQLIDVVSTGSAAVAIWEVWPIIG